MNWRLHRFARKVIEHRVTTARKLVWQAFQLSGCPPSSILFSFVIKTIVATTLSSCENNGMDIFLDRKIVAKYAGDFVILSESPS